MSFTVGNILVIVAILVFVGAEYGKITTKQKELQKRFDEDHKALKELMLKVTKMEAEHNFYKEKNGLHS